MVASIFMLYQSTLMKGHRKLQQRKLVVEGWAWINALLRAKEKWSEWIITFSAP